MQTVTQKERSQLLRKRARRLLFFVETFDGKPNRTIELEAYLILQTYESRPRAIWKYMRHALRDWSYSKKARLELGALTFWYRRIKRLNREAAIELAYKTVEDRIFGAEKGENHGRSH